MRRLEGNLEGIFLFFFLTAARSSSADRVFAVARGGVERAGMH